MTRGAPKWKAWGALALVAALGIAWIATLDREKKISTDVLELVPADERIAEITIVRQLASQTEARTMLIELTRDGRPAGEQATAEFVTRLRKSPAFDAAVAMGDAVTRERMARALFDRRFEMVFPRWLARQRAIHGEEKTGAGFPEWLVQRVVSDLDAFLERPEALGWQELLPRDPLLLMPGVATELEGSSFAPTDAPGLVWARLAASPLSEAGQAPAFEAIENAAAAARRIEPGIEVRYSGINRFAAASRARIEREVSWINLLSLAAVLAVALLFVRDPRRGLHLVPVMLLSILGAWTISTLVFDRLHIFVLVIGSLLAGVAIDYGFYLFMQPPAAPGEPYAAKVRRLAKPLLASCFTTVAGFALLLLSDLPMIRQLGVFVGAGLLTALVVAVVYFSGVNDPFLPARSWGSRALRLRGARLPSWILLGVGLVAAAGLLRLEWRDDIRDLEIPAPELRAEDERIRGRFGQQRGRMLHLSYGRNLTEARAALEQFAARHEGRLSSLAPIFPLAEEFRAAREFLTQNPGFGRRLVAALVAGGYEPDGFAEFVTAYAQAAARAPRDYETAMAEFLAELQGPAALLAHRGESLSWLASIVDVSTTPSVATPQTIAINQLQSLNRVFSKYRASALRLSLGGLAVVGIGVFLMYGLRDGARIFAIPCAACAGVFGLLGWLGLPLNLFHLLGAFLGVCLTHNYSIFTATSAFRGEGPPVSVRLSALTTAASFAALAASGIPVVRALGMTVSLMVLVALLMIELEHLAPLGRKR